MNKPDWRYMFVKYVGIVSFGGFDDYLESTDWNEDEWNAIHAALGADDLMRLYNSD